MDGPAPLGLTYGTIAARSRLRFSAIILEVLALLRIRLGAND
jgi:hypothetical protein